MHVEVFSCQRGRQAVAVQNVREARVQGLVLVGKFRLVDVPTKRDINNHDKSQ